MKLASTLLTCLLACAVPTIASASQPALAIPQPVTELPTVVDVPATAGEAWELSANELDELAQAQLQADDLAELRGGAITNDDLLTILLVAGIIVLIAIIV